MSSQKDGQVDVWAHPDVYPVTTENQSAIDPILIIEKIEDVDPLEDQIGNDLEKMVPDALYDAMFGQRTGSQASDEISVQSPVTHTYAVLDGAKVPNLPEILEASGLDHECLFNGKAYDNLKDVAPWIVQLHEDNSFTRSLFTKGDAPWQMWDREPGLYIRSRNSLEELRQHLRRFTKIQNEHGKWFYFRISDVNFLSEAIRFKTDFIYPIFSEISRIDSIILIYNGRVDFCKRNRNYGNDVNRKILIRECDRPLFISAHFRSIRQKCKNVLEGSKLENQHLNIDCLIEKIFPKAVEKWYLFEFLKVNDFFYILLIKAARELGLETHREDIWEKIYFSKNRNDFVINARIYLKKSYPSIYEAMECL